MSSLKPVVGVLALVASLALTPVALAAEAVVPPGNSAATQYTEAIPTSGGAKTNSAINGDASPTKVLGSHNAKKLEDKGEVGHEVAELAAETAPAPVSSEATPAAKPPAVHHHKKGAAGGSGSGNSGGGNGGGGKSPSTGAQTETGGVQAGGGSSGLGEVLAQATGSSSGQLGLFLPLIVIGTVLWSLNYLWRQRRTVG